MKVKPKKNVDIPPEVRSFTERVVTTPMENISEALSGFSWRYDKGDFHHWIPLFNYFDTFFEREIRTRGDLTLNNEESNDGDPPFPVHNTVAVLKVTTRILENCTNKHLYQSYEHLTELLAAQESEVVIGALQALVAFLRKTHQSSVRFHGYPLLILRLFDLSKGWGGKEQGLDMSACAHENVDEIKEYVKDGSALHFEFYKESKAEEESQGLKVIHLDNVHQMMMTEHQILAKLVLEYDIPADLRFRLLSRIRIALNFARLEGRRGLVKMRLLAFCVLVQSNPLHQDMTAFFASEPEFMTELVDLIQTDSGIPLELRTLALRAMTVQLVDRSRHSAVISAVGVGGSNGILAILLQDSIECICSSDRPSCSSKKPRYNASFVEAILVLIAALISSGSGNINLNESGYIPALLPLIQDPTPGHVTLVCSAVKILEGFMDYSSTASAMFRGMGGLTAMIARLEAEVRFSNVDESMASPSSPSQGVKRQRSNEPAKPQVSYLRRLLMKSLLRAIALASYAPTVGTASRLEDADARALYGCLKAIFIRAKEFGGALFAFAATVATDLIHNYPLCFGELDEAGVPNAFLDAVCEGVLPSSEAVCSIPNTLVAFCLNAGGLQKVKDRKVLQCLTHIFTSKKYIKALSGDTASILGAGVDELFRHVSDLKDEGVQYVVVDTLRLLCYLGGDSATIEHFRKQDDNGHSLADALPLEMQERGSQTGVDTSLPECVCHAAKMLEALLSNSDTSRRFAQNEGVELLLKLYTLPKMPSSFASSSQSNPLLSIFRSLTHNNCPALHVCIPAVLGTELNASISAAEKLGDVCVPALDADMRETYIRQIASTSGLTAVAGTVARTSAPMVTEMCKGEQSLIATLGTIERQILKQLSRADARIDRKSRMKKTSDDGDVTPAVEDSEAEKTDTEIDAMDIEQDYVIPDLAPNMNTEAEMQTMNGAKTEEKKAPDEVAYDILSNFIGTIRNLYTSVAKANHTPARRRDESFAHPSISMKAAALALALVLKHNLDFEIENLREPGMYCYIKHLTRLVEEVQLVLFDTRRHCCHTLILNYFVAVQGFASLSKRFEGVVELLWSAIECASKQAGPSTSDSVLDSEQKNAVEQLMLSFVNVFSQLTNPRLLCQSAQTASLLVVPLPSKEDTGDKMPENGVQEAENFVKNLQESVLKTVLSVWSNPLFAKTSHSVTSNVIGILNSCLDGSGSLAATFRAIRNDVRFGLGRTVPDQNMIQQIIDMGFSRARAMQALRRIGQNSVEMAMEWLVSHPDEPDPEANEDTRTPQEQELATAMVSSLSGLVNSASQPESSSQPPSESIHVLDLVTGAVSVLEKNPVSAFSVSSFIMTLCNRTAGKDRETVIQWFIATLNKTIVSDSDLVQVASKMNATAHLLALMMAESIPCRELAIEVCMIPAIMRALKQWDEIYIPSSEIHSWIEGLLLVLDFLSQTQHHRAEGSSDEDTSSHNSDVQMGEDREKTPLEKIVGRWAPAGAIDEKERHEIVEFCIKLLKHLHVYGKEWIPTPTTQQNATTQSDPAGVTQAVIQLLASITRCHQTALKFLHCGGVDLLLSLPASCILLRHESYISSILKHILEDDATLQSVMESEIKNVFSTQRRPLGQLPFYDWERMPVRNFLQKLSLLAYRSPTIFSKAVNNLCMLADGNGGSNQVICLKKSKSQTKPTPAATPCTEKGHSGESSSSSAKKGNKKVVLLSFVEVIDRLLEQVMQFNLTQPSGNHSNKDQSEEQSKQPVEDAEADEGNRLIELPTPRVATVEDGNGLDPLDSALFNNTVSRQTLMENRDVIMQVMVLNMLAEFSLVYGSTVGVLLKRDGESLQQDTNPGQETPPGLFKRVLHGHLSWNVTSNGIKPVLPGEASRFLQAVCIRSAEGRRRILLEIVTVLSCMPSFNSIDGKQPASGNSPFISSPNAPAADKIKALIELIGHILATSGNTKTTNLGNQRHPLSTTGLTVELVRSMRQVGVVSALIHALELVDMNHPDASKAVYSIIKPLEILTRSIPVLPKKTQQQSSEPPPTAEAQPEEEPRLTSSDAFVVASSPAAPPEQLSPDLMEEDLHEMDERQLFYEALENINELVEERSDAEMHSNAEDAMEEDDEEEDDSDSSHSSSESGSFHEDGPQEERVVVDEESVELDNEHEELDATDEEALEEDDEEEDEMEDGEEDDDASADMELDDGEDWEEDAAIREYTEALDRIESVVRGAEEQGDFLNARFIAHGGDGTQHNLRSVLGNMLGTFLGPGEENRQDRRGRIRYGILARDRAINVQAPFSIQPLAPAQHRLLTRPNPQTAGNDEIATNRIIPDAFGRRHGQIVPGEGRWRQLAFQGMPTTIRNIQAGDGNDYGYYVVTGDRGPGRHGGTFGATTIFDGDRGAGDASLQQSRTVGANWMSSVLGQFEQHFVNALPRQEPPPQSPARSGEAQTTQQEDTAPSNDVAPAAPTEDAEPQPSHQPADPEPIQEQPDAQTPPPSSVDAVQDDVVMDEVEQAEDDAVEEVDVMEEDPPIPVPQGTDNSAVEATDPVANSNDQPDTSGVEAEAVGSVDAAQSDALPEDVVTRAAQSGIDATFLQALPRTLQLEILAERGISLNQPAQNEQNPAQGEEGDGDAAQEVAPEGVDPEFLAALPPDIREEVLETQRAEERRRDVERTIVEGQPDDVANIIASLPDEIREEVLLYGEPDIIANLPSNLLAEGQRIRERHIRHIGRDNDDPLASNVFFRRLRQNAGIGRDGRVQVKKERKEELEGPSAIDLPGLTRLINLLSLNAPVIKAQLQKLFLNLCVRNDCRRLITQLLVQRLRSSDPETARNTTVITRRVLDLLSYLARHQTSKVAEVLLDVRVHSTPSAEEQLGKLPMHQAAAEPRALEILLEMLGQPLCLRSVSTLEQDLQLLEVVLQSAVEQRKEALKAADAETPSASTSQAQTQLDSLQTLPTLLLKVLPEIIGRDGLSDRAYKSAAAVVKLVVEAVPAFQRYLLRSLKAQIDDQAQEACTTLTSLVHDGMSRAATHSLGGTGARVLRVLHSVNTLTAQTTEDDRTDNTILLQNVAETLERIWSDLHPVIAEIESNIRNSGQSDTDANASARVLPTGAAQTLPFIESFFVLCSAQSQLSVSEEEESKSSGDISSALMTFAERHRILLNAFLRQTPTLLEGSFKVLIRSPRLIEFDNKRHYFRGQLRSDDRGQYSSLRINVRREHVFEDSFYQLRHRSVDTMRCKLSVQFTNEEGIDAGGVSREWYQVMAREIFNPNLALFIAVPDGASTFQPNPNSIIQNDRGVNHLDFFKFVGRLVGKAVYDGQLIDAHFTRSFYKHMLNQPLTYQDLEAVDVDFYKQMKWILDNDITDILVGQTFAAETDFFGRKEVVELKENGSSTPITESNKKEYVNLMTQHKMTTAIRDQIKAFQQGFWELIPKDLISIFNDHELELIICGLPEVDVADIKANTEYTGYTAASQAIQWFWSIVEEFDAENLALLLQFVTGTSKVPLDGFQHLQGISGPQKFQIHKSYASDNRLPTAHTCFNQLDLPEYKSREQLKDRLLLAIHEGREGFGFG